MSALILACDVGNSRTKYGFFRHEDNPNSPGELPSCLLTMTVDHTDVSQTGHEIHWDAVRHEQLPNFWDGATKIVGVIAGSSPEKVATAQKNWPRDWADEPLVIERPTELPIDVDLVEPERVGMDRLLNGIAINQQRCASTPTIIIDAGTATTVDLIDETGTFCGGAILPGLELSARALHRETALLPLIDIAEFAAEFAEQEQLSNKQFINEQRQATEPPPAIGRETRAAMHSGLFWGQVGAIRELVAQISSSVEKKSVSPKLVITGGASQLLRSEFPQADWKPFLSLQGLALTAIHPNGEPH